MRSRLVAWVFVIAAALAASPGFAQYCPVKVGAWDEGPASDLEIVGDHVVFSSGTWLRVVNISAQDSPQLVGETRLTVEEQQLSGSWIELALSGDLVLLAAGDAGLLIADISDPTLPREIGAFDTPGYAMAIDAIGSYAFVTVANHGLLILDVSDPAHVVVSATLTRTGIVGAAASADRLFVADTALSVYDISDPARPELLGEPRPLEGVFSDLATGGRLVHLLVRTGDGNWPLASLEVLGFDAAQEPALVGRLSGWGGGPRRALFQSGYLFATDWDGGLCILDVNDPTDPRLLAAYQLPVPGGLEISGRHLIVADALEGLQIFDLGPCSSTEPEAAFQHWPERVRAGEPVHFAERSEGLATSFVWDFGDGTTSRRPNQTHTFEQPGDYVVKLTVSNNNGTDISRRRLRVRESVSEQVDTPAALLDEDW